MGDRVRALGAEMTRADHARAIARIEKLAEEMHEDLDAGAAFESTVNFKALPVRGKTTKNTRWIPRGAPLLINEGHVWVPHLIAEIRRRDDLLRKAAERLAEDPYLQDSPELKAIRAFLAED